MSDESVERVEQARGSDHAGDSRHTGSTEGSGKSKASLFDIRNIVGALLGIYGVILVLVSFGTSADQKAKSDGVNANLWVGLVLVVFGVLMIVWAVTRPIVVDEAQVEHDKQEAEERPLAH